MAKLTKRALEAMTPPEKGKQAFLWDGELRGFGVRMLPSGLQTFVLNYRNAANKERRINLGRFGVMTVEQAREKAKVKLGMIADGDDPADADKDPHHQQTVSALCDWYLAEAEAGRILGRRNRPIKKSTLAMDKSRIETHIKPLLGSRLAHTLKVADIEGMQSDIVAGKTAKPRGGGRGGVTTGGPGVASRAVGTLQSILGHAARLDKIESHPSRGARKLAGKKKQRRLSVAEIKKLGAAMRHAERNGESPVALAIVRFLALTGFRISEGQGVQRHWLNAGVGYVAFPTPRAMRRSVRSALPPRRSLPASRLAAIIRMSSRPILPTAISRRPRPASSGSAPASVLRVSRRTRCATPSAASPAISASPS